MELREGIKSQFSLLGFELTDAVLDKCEYSTNIILE